MSSRESGRGRARLASLRHDEEAAITYLKDLGSNISRFTYYIYIHTEPLLPCTSLTPLQRRFFKPLPGVSVVRPVLRSRPPSPELKRPASVRVSYSARRRLYLRLIGWVTRLVLDVASRFLPAVRREGLQRSAVRVLRDAATKAHGASADTRGVIGLQGLLRWLSEHLVILNGSQPVGRGGREVVASAQSSALDERSRAELFEAGPRRDERLSAATCACVPVLQV